MNVVTPSHSNEDDQSHHPGCDTVLLPPPPLGVAVSTTTTTMTTTTNNHYFDAIWIHGRTLSDTEWNELSIIKVRHAFHLFFFSRSWFFILMLHRIILVSHAEYGKATTECDGDTSKCNVHHTAETICTIYWDGPRYDGRRIFYDASQRRLESYIRTYPDDATHDSNHSPLQQQYKW